MSTYWSPKPMRQIDDSLFQMTEAPTVVKSLTPIQRQRLRDGTPHTNGALSSLRAPEPTLVLSPALVKGSLVAEYDSRPKPINQDPPDPMTVVKSYLAYKPNVAKSEEAVKSLNAMTSAIKAFAAKTGA